MFFSPGPSSQLRDAGSASDKRRDCSNDDEVAPAGGAGDVGTTAATKMLGTARARWAAVLKVPAWHGCEAVVPCLSRDAGKAARHG